MSVETIRKNGRTRYLARWRQDGRQRARTFDRKRDAEAFERERRREVALGAHGLPEPSPMTLGDLDAPMVGAGGDAWAPSTRRTYANLIDLWIVPFAEGGGCATSATPASAPGAQRSAWRGRQRPRPTRPPASSRRRWGSPSARG